MELFSEIYGCYYQVAAEILRTAPLTRRQAEALAAERGYGESVLHLIPKLLDGEAWPLLEERDGQLHSRLRQKPEMPVTALERAWLKAVLGDARIRLFLTDGQLARLSDALADVEPLWRQEDLVYFDRYLDGDCYEDLGYRVRFQQILAAMKAGRFLHITYQPPRGRESRGHYRPLRLEYSAKDDKFRAYVVRARNGAFQGYHVLNLSRIAAVQASAERYDGTLDLEAWRQRRRSGPLLLRVSRERNGIERFMVEFSSYEKQSEYDEEAGACLVRLWYQKDDETETLIRLLGFGPVVQVLAPESFVKQIRQRVLQQKALLDGAPPGNAFAPL